MLLSLVQSKPTIGVGQSELFFLNLLVQTIFLSILNIQTDVDAGPPCSESCCNSPKKGAGIKKELECEKQILLLFLLAQ